MHGSNLKLPPCPEGLSFSALSLCFFLFVLGEGVKNPPLNTTKKPQQKGVLGIFLMPPPPVPLSHCGGQEFNAAVHRRWREGLTLLGMCRRGPQCTVQPHFLCLQNSKEQARSAPHGLAVCGRHVLAGLALMALGAVNGLWLFLVRDRCAPLKTRLFPLAAPVRARVFRLCFWAVH